MRGVVSDRFFDQQMFSATQQFAADLEMSIGRRGDRGRINLFGKFFQRRRRLDPKFGCPLLRDRAVGIVDCGELRAG